jgi:hypothetical protein
MRAVSSKMAWRRLNTPSRDGWSKAQTTMFLFFVFARDDMAPKADHGLSDEQVLPE